MESNFHLFHIQNWLKCEKYVLIHLIHESTHIIDRNSLLYIIAIANNAKLFILMLRR